MERNWEKASFRKSHFDYDNGFERLFWSQAGFELNR
jgi:hypothetical protein